MICKEKASINRSSTILLQFAAEPVPKHPHSIFNPLKITDIITKMKIKVIAETITVAD
jgi:hypothetical protein